MMSFWNHSMKIQRQAANGLRVFEPSDTMLLCSGRKVLQDRKALLFNIRFGQTHS